MAKLGRVRWGGGVHVAAHSQATSTLELPSQTLPGIPSLKQELGHPLPQDEGFPFPLVNGKEEVSPEGEREHQAQLQRPGGTAASPLTRQDPGSNSPDDQISASAP